MSKMYGWMGKILRINLTTGDIRTTPSEQFAEGYVGGRGFVVKHYWEEVSPDMGALHPDNPLIIMTGPLAGTPAYAATRWCIAGKSPRLYPEQFGIGNVGGMMGIMSKAFCGKWTL